MTASKSRQLSWRPVSRGKLFCAPACGRGCTHAEHRTALEAAARLCKDLGPGWKPRVWENLGWHWSAISRCGRIKVHGGKPGIAGRRGEYTAFFGDAASLGGRWIERGRTPRAAVCKVIKRGSDERAYIDGLLRGLPDLGGRR